MGNQKCDNADGLAEEKRSQPTMLRRRHKRKCLGQNLNFMKIVNVMVDNIIAFVQLYMKRSLSMSASIFCCLTGIYAH